MRRHRFPFLLALAGWLMVAAAPVIAHEIDEEHESSPISVAPRNLHELWHTWGWEPGSMIGLAIAGVWYAVGLRRTWRSSGVGHGIRRWEAACYAGGWIALFVALISPL